MELSLKLNDYKKIEKAHGLDAKGNKFLRDTVDRFCDPYIPMDSGTTKNNKTYPSDHEIKYISPNAHYDYKEAVMQN